MTKDEALRLALKALEMPWNAPYVDGCDLALGKKVKAITAIKAVLKAKDEPVAIVDSRISGNVDWLCTFFPKQGTPLYITPQKRTWVGLTDEEKQEWIDAMPSPPQPRHFMVLVNAIEFELKEKNT